MVTAASNTLQSVGCVSSLLVFGPHGGVGRATLSREMCGVDRCFEVGWKYGDLQECRR